MIYNANSTFLTTFRQILELNKQSYECCSRFQPINENQNSSLTNHYSFDLIDMAAAFFNQVPEMEKRISYVFSLEKTDQEIGREVAVLKKFYQEYLKIEKVIADLSFSIQLNLNNLEKMKKTYEREIEKRKKNDKKISQSIETNDLNIFLQNKIKIEIYFQMLREINLELNLMLEKKEHILKVLAELDQDSLSFLNELKQLLSKYEKKTTIFPCVSFSNNSLLKEIDQIKNEIIELKSLISAFSSNQIDAIEAIKFQIILKEEQLNTLILQSQKKMYNPIKLGTVTDQTNGYSSDEEKKIEDDFDKESKLKYISIDEILKEIEETVSILLAIENEDYMVKHPYLEKLKDLKVALQNFDTKNRG